MTVRVPRSRVGRTSDGGPKAIGLARASSRLRGASNVLLQDVCPGRSVSHIGVRVDPVSFALLRDAITHRGPGRASRLPRGVCTRRFAPGLDAATTVAVLDASLGLVAGRLPGAEQLSAEPPLRSWMRRGS